MGGETIVQGRAWDPPTWPALLWGPEGLRCVIMALCDELLRSGLPALLQCRGHPIPVITGDCVLPLGGASAPLCQLLSGPQQSTVSLQSPGINVW